MLQTTLRKLYHRSKNIWIRVILIAVLAFFAVFLAKLLGRFIPHWMNDYIGADAVNRMLDILASSMLAVTTFSLSVMVSIHRSVSSQWSPRAHRVHLRDTRTQTVLATFIGAYIYALNAIILLETPFFNAREVVVVFLMTLAVVGLIVVTIIRWILHLQTMGSLVDTARRIEKGAVTAFVARMKQPTLGANPLTEDTVIPDDAVPVPAWKTGFLSYLYEGAISEMAQEEDVLVYLMPGIGGMIQKGEPLAFLSRPSDRVFRGLRSGVVIGDLRSPEQDPKFAVRMLAEIGSKALSPGINDAGTAIDMIQRVGRVMDSYEGVQRDPMHPDTLRHAQLFIRPIDPGDILMAGLEPIARDGAAEVDVMRALMRMLTQMGAHADPQIADAALTLRDRALARSQDAIAYATDFERVRALAG